MLSEVQEHQRAAGCGLQQRDESNAPLQRLASVALDRVLRQPLNPYVPVKLVVYVPPKRE